MGLGFLLRRLRSDHVFDALGHRWYLDHRIGSVYASVLAGAYLEPETHALLQYLAQNSPEPFTFIDVGSNFGEMLIAVATQPAVRQIIAFEPHPVCAEVCRRNLELNGVRNATVHELLVGDGTTQPFVIDSEKAALSGIRPGNPDAPAVPTTRLDDVLEPSTAAILMIDVEGAELDVLRGGHAFIRHARPFIIFEYHDQTRERYSLDDVIQEIGADYEVFRLRAGGDLDPNLDIRTWNCVAVHRQSVWFALCRSRMLKHHVL
jgi:FkbM family methyltransferase